MEGVVHDQGGALVTGAHVTLQGKAYKQSMATSANGNFSFSAVPAEEATLTVEAPGFNPFARSVPPEQREIDIVLTVGPTSTRVDVTANRSTINLDETAESVAILSRQAFEVEPGVPLDIVLEQLPGFSLFRRSDSREANPTSQGVSLRGVGASGASRALVLDNGVPLNDPFGGWVYWGRVPSESVGAVEVLRGGASSLYGGDALSGVINILPRRSEDNLFSAQLSMGTEATPDISGMDSLKFGKWQVDSSTDLFRTAGYILVPDAIRGTVDTPADSSHQAVQSELTRTLHSGDMFVSGSFYNENRNNGTALQTNGTQLWQVSTGADFSTRAGSLQLRGFGGGESFNQTFSSVAVNRNSESLVDSQHVPAQNIGASLLWTGNAGKRNSLVAGTDASNEEGLTEDLGFTASLPRSQVNAGGSQLYSGVFVQDMLRVTPRLLFTGGIRYDNWDNYDSQSQTIPFVPTVKPALTHFVEQSEHAFTPRGAVLYNANGHVTFTGSAYRAFRPPTLNELYRSFRLGNTLTNANSQLVAERLWGAEGGVNLMFSRARIHTGFFWMQISNPIENVTLTTTPSLITAERENLGQTRSRGVEADVQWRIKSIDLRAGYQFTDAVVTSFPGNAQFVGLQVPEVAPHQFTLQASYGFSQGWTLAVITRTAGRQFDDALNQFPLAGFFQLDAYIAKRLGNRAETFVDVSNLTNARIEIEKTPQVNLGSPIVARAGIKLNFK